MAHGFQPLRAVPGFSGLRLCRRYLTCEDVELGSVGSSDVVGEMSLITGLPRCATIEVTEDATLFVIHAVNFERLMSENVELAARFCRNMLASLCTKLRQSNVHLASRLGV